MAFSEIERGTWGGKAPLENCVRAWAGKSNSSVLTIGIAYDIYKKIGSPLFINVLVGSGEHDGLVAMIPRNTRGKSSYKLTGTKGAKKSAMRFSVSASLIGLPPAARKPGNLPFEITEDGLIVDVRQLRRIPDREGARNGVFTATGLVAAE